MKLKVLIHSFVGCSGCISTLMSLDVFPQFLERTNILHFPFICDNHIIEDNFDFALIEGCISEESQIDVLRRIRKQSKKVYAFGSCAAFGGILSLSNHKDAHPLTQYIEIDGFIPGCPPPYKLLGNMIITLIERKEIVLPKKVMCAECPYREDLTSLNDLTIEKFFPTNDDIEFEGAKDNCFLKRGILCLGPITRDGCDHKCIKQGIPCEGCVGPVAKDFVSNLVNFLSLFKISKNLQNYDEIFYRFSRPEMMR
ncbi:MAG: hypothetical protein GF383_00100 [Candidatus Lokiarchaeota archaeon]|nr:hypothetical protein [Candidatus Lokiarchaeota archaeon]MBD3337495.1 hypothetical protein [Candidatus Lokiarchaeota archaeon]